MRNGQVSSRTLLAPDRHRAEAKRLSLKIDPAADAMAGIGEGDPMAGGETKRLNKGCTIAAIIVGWWLSVASSP
jgi:hypothetical protein